MCLLCYNTGHTTYIVRLAEPVISADPLVLDLLLNSNIANLSLYTLIILYYDFFMKKRDCNNNLLNLIICI